MKQDLASTTLVVLMAGSASRLEPLSYGMPKGLLSINSQPAINHMITPLANRGLSEAVFVVSPQFAKVVEAFIKKSYPDLTARFVVQPEPDGPLNAFKCAVPYLHQSTLLLYGDTLCSLDRIKFDKSFFGIFSQINNRNKQYGLIKKNRKNRITEVNYASKKSDKEIYTIIGLYYFKNFEVLKAALKQACSGYSREQEIYGMQQYYCNNEPTKAVEFPDWQDSGTLAGYAESATKNSPLSKRGGRAADGVYVLGPNGTVQQETCDYLTLEEYYNFYPIRTDNFAVIFRQLLSHFHAVTPAGICHGNLTFSNILYSPRTGDFKLINPVLDSCGKPFVCNKHRDLAAMYFSAHRLPNPAAEVFDNVLIEAGYDLQEINNFIKSV
ncbi:MAG: sugar phosphate nucleotidyltransferase [Firmicutes bacterium]|nr:sugar phosphate nucleotidyltransferase [Bacillota bacterium]